MIMTGEELYVV